MNIPGSVETIGDFAFYGCSAISMLNLSEGLTGIGDDAFNYVPGLVPTYKIENGSLVLKGDDPANILDSVVIPSTVTSIGDNFLQGALKIDGSSIVVFIGKTAPQMGSNAFATSYNTENSDFDHKLNLYYPASSEDSYETAMGGCYSPSNGYFLTVEYSKVSVSAGGTVEMGIESGPSGLTLSATSSDSTVDAEIDNGKINIVGEEVGEYTVTVYLMLGQRALTETTIDVTVKELSDNSTTTSTTTDTTVDEDTQQTITTTTTTVTDKTTGEELSTTTTISTETTDGIKTEATVLDDKATVTVTAGSGTSLSDVVEQTELISNFVKEDESLPNNISETKIVIGDTDGVSVTLTLEVVKSLNDQTTVEGASVQIMVGNFEGGSMTSAQISALGSGTAFELSALLVHDGGATEPIHELGGYVDAFLPYSESMGDPSKLSVFYIDENGKTTDMKSTYNEERGGFVFKTNHFSHRRRG